VTDLLVRENYSDYIFLPTFWKLCDYNLSLGDMEIITLECDWTAGCPYDWLGYYRHNDNNLNALTKSSLSALDFERYELSERPHTESFIIFVILL
jgi:hypothetical protein